MFKSVVFAAVGALALCASGLTGASAAPVVHNHEQHRIVANPHRPMRHDTMRRGGRAMAGPRRVEFHAMPHPGWARVVVRRGRTVVINRVVVRNGRRIVVDRPQPVFLGGRPMGFRLGGGVPRAGCTARRSVSLTPFGWHKIVTVRTCLVP